MSYMAQWGDISCSLWRKKAAFKMPLNRKISDYLRQFRD